MLRSELYFIVYIPNIIGKNDNPHDGANMYVFRYQYVNEKWVIKNSKPCTHCVKIIKASGIKKVFYSVSDENQVGIVSVSAKKLNNDYVTSANRKKSMEK